MKAVLSGSFQRDPDGLRQAFDRLMAAGCAISSPRSVEFVAEHRGFVLAEHERNDPPEEIERRHLGAIEEADFVWLHAPEGYVGRSASLEVGFALAHGVPVFTDVVPDDVCLAALVRVVSGVEDATAQHRHRSDDPGRALRRLQRYYAEVAIERGYSDETIQDTMLLLTEEVGELARAVRKRVGLLREGVSASGDAAEELADVQLYLVHLANILDVDLSTAVSDKEDENDRRFRARALSQTA